jgi:hypothetical protein
MSTVPETRLFRQRESLAAPTFRRQNLVRNDRRNVPRPPEQGTDVSENLAAGSADSSHFRASMMERLISTIGRRHRPVWQRGQK